MAVKRPLANYSGTIKELATGDSLAGVEFASNAEYIAGTETGKALNPAVARAQNVIKGTAQAASGQSAINFTDIPSWVTNIVIQVINVSMSSTQDFGLQIGDSGGLETSGYIGSVSRIGSGSSSVSAFSGSFLAGAADGAAAHSGSFVLARTANTNRWQCSITLGTTSANYNNSGAGTKVLPATLYRFSFVAESGTFDAGSFNYIAW